MNTALRPLLGTLLLSLPLLAMSGDKTEQPQQAYTSKGSAPLVEKVRRATSRYKDIGVAIAESWVPATPCVSGPNAGAMGVHFVLPSRVGDGAIDGDEPEALIYEPLSSGAMRLVGVEFIVIAGDWASKHPEGGAPSVDGHLMHYVSEPNRYGLPAFYELHVWAWEQNPDGHFSDWNKLVTCNKQRAQ
ncbi:hypothetical protein [Steroidobacter sp.]|uniref:hypothetical protein n=1 Tax=Steroidobacter sp. TaxID=1978227 RepID=UPI001A39ACF6|nr:hypothetical protein [Steroidobacter sp.]MBL8268027.1 hypothetical protein [Steroidobacter sp.]